MQTVSPLYEISYASVNHINKRRFCGMWSNYKVFLLYEPVNGSSSNLLYKKTSCTWGTHAVSLLNELSNAYVSCMPEERTYYIANNYKTSSLSEHSNVAADGLTGKTIWRKENSYMGYPQCALLSDCLIPLWEKVELCLSGRQTCYNFLLFRSPWP